MLLQRRIVLGTPKSPIMVLEKHSIDTSKYCLNEVRKELLEHAEASNSDVWGFYPGMKNEKEQYPSKQR